jgi:hypothetical protein
MKQDIKRKYEKPEMQVFQIKQTQHLLTESLYYDSNATEETVTNMW